MLSSGPTAYIILLCARGFLSHTRYTHADIEAHKSRRCALHSWFLEAIHATRMLTLKPTNYVVVLCTRGFLRPYTLHAC